MAHSYPPDQASVFTDRLHELATLQQAAEALQQGRPQHIALFGLRRIGKTLLCREQVQRLLAQDQIIPVYMDLEDLCSSPEIFAQRYIGLTCFWALRVPSAGVDAYLAASSLLQTRAAEIPVVARTLGTLLGELAKQKADYSLLLNLAFEFPERMGEAMGRPLIVFLDEFPELGSLANFPGVGDPLKHFRSSLQRQSRVSYVVTGSAISAMVHLLRDHESPLFLQFRALELRPLTREDTRILSEKLVGDLSPASHAAVFAYTFGHPFYVTALAARLREMRLGEPEEVKPEHVAQGFLLEALGSNGQIYGYCRYLYDISLQKARGYGMLKAALQTLAVEDGLSLSDLARRVRRQASAVRESLRWLIEVDILCERERRYYYCDPVLRFWVAQSTRGIQLEEFPRPENLSTLVAELQERFQRTANQLGRAKESEVRELLRRLAGRVVEGAYLGHPGPLAVPAFTRVEPYRSPDGQVELDALAQDGESWAVEVKWRQKRVGPKELQELVEHAKLLGARGWCISQAGFTPEALALAREQGIFFSAAKDLERLAQSAIQLSAA